MFHYAMKAAVSTSQIADRVRKFEELDMPPAIELFIKDFEEIEDRDGVSTANCRQFEQCEYLVHIPLYDPKDGYIFDVLTENGDRLKLALDFCAKVGSKSLVIHRCYGFSGKMTKKDAEEAFLKKIIAWERIARKSGVRLLIENYGFAWLPKSMKVDYVSSPIDHFFPWDISEFNRKTNELNLKNVSILLDIAHTVISSNMFNMLKAYPELSSDPRFGNIYPEDLEKKDLLRPEDFVSGFITYFHVSDSFIWRRQDGVGDLHKYLYTECLPIGKGNVDYRNIFKGIAGDKLIIMEIDPENKDYDDNISQLKAIRVFEKYYNQRSKVCA